MGEEGARLTRVCTLRKIEDTKAVRALQRADKYEQAINGCLPVRHRTQYGMQRWRIGAGNISGNKSSKGQSEMEQTYTFKALLTSLRDYAENNTIHTLQFGDCKKCNIDLLWMPLADARRPAIAR